MKVINLSEQNSVLNNFIREIRDVKIQKDSMRFRKNIERIGEIISIELSKTLKYIEIDVKTPLGTAQVNVIDEHIVIASILRAGLTLHNGVLAIFDKAQNAFISAYRKYTADNKFNIHVDYISSPNIDGKTLIIADPMLATGSSMDMCYQALLQKGIPAQLHIISVIASKQSIVYLEKVMPKNTVLWIATIDDNINEHAYIVPGLGDAGDLAYGEKID